jgi:PAS domain S-box-containing protein
MVHFPRRFVMPKKKDVKILSETHKQKKSTRVARKPRAITERKQMMDAVRASEDKFKYMFDHSSIGRSMTLPSGEINVNQALSEMLGYTQDEIKNCNWQEITHPEDVQLTQNEMDALISGEKESVRFIKRYIHKNGSVIFGDVGSVLRRDKDGKPHYFISTIMDITERKLAEEALQESRTLQNAIVESTSDMIWSVDPEHFGLLTFNRGLRDYFKEERRIEIKLGDRPEDLFPDAEFVDRWHLMFNRALKEKSYCVEYQVFAGSRILELTFNLLKRDNKPFGISVFGKDITERKQAEEALRKKMEELERFQHLAVGRELRMIELKKEINALLVQSGQTEKYPLPLESHSERSQ